MLRAAVRHGPVSRFAKAAAGTTAVLALGVFGYALMAGADLREALMNALPWFLLSGLWAIVLPILPLSGFVRAVHRMGSWVPGDETRIFTQTGL